MVILYQNKCVPNIFRMCTRCLWHKCDYFSQITGENVVKMIYIWNILLKYE